MNFLQEENVRPDINIVSLIDVVLILLIFMMISTQFVTQSGIEVNLPQAVTEEVKSTEELIVTLTRKGNIYFRGRRLTEESLRKKLESLASKYARTKPIIIRADKKVPHGRVVTMMDIAKESGFAKLAIATEKLKRR
jgi:biopolymer transport protein ExbD/biopolymer transport protein TolR